MKLEDSMEGLGGGKRTKKGGADYRTSREF